MYSPANTKQSRTDGPKPLSRAGEAHSSNEQGDTHLKHNGRRATPLELPATIPNLWPLFPVTFLTKTFRQEAPRLIRLPGRQ